MKNFAQFARQAKQMQEKMMQAQEELAQKKVEASAGGGAVSVTANGQGQLCEIRISKDVLRPDNPEAVEAADLEMLQDLVLSAVNQALEKVKTLAAEEMAKAAGLPGGMGGLSLPGLM